MKQDPKQLISILNSGGIAVVRTDTLYGLLARAEDEAAVKKVYEVKQRDPSKSCIVLIADSSQAYGDLSNTIVSDGIPTSILVDAPKAPAWLLRTNNQLAHRIPNNDFLKDVIRETGPLIAPSANPESLPPASTIDEARAYFGDVVDIYIDGGAVSSDIPPSRLIRVTATGDIERLR